MLIKKNNKNITNFIFFKDIFGIGVIRAKKIVQMLGLKSNTDISQLKKRKRYIELRELLESKNIEDKLRLNILTHLYKLKRRRTYRGLRSSAKLPVRGQRTHTNNKSQAKLSTFSRFFTEEYRNMQSSRRLGRIVNPNTPRRLRKAKKKKIHTKEVIQKKKKNPGSGKAQYKLSFLLKQQRQRTRLL